jgi:hypothetical protein
LSCQNGQVRGLPRSATGFILNKVRKTALRGARPVMIWTVRVIEKSSVVCAAKKARKREKCENFLFHKKNVFWLVNALTGGSM